MVHCVDAVFTLVSDAVSFLQLLTTFSTFHQTWSPQSFNCIVFWICPQVYERGTNVEQFVTRFLLKESANQIQSLLSSVESAVDAIDEQHSQSGWDGGARTAALMCLLVSVGSNSFTLSTSSSIQSPTRQGQPTHVRRAQRKHRTGLPSEQQSRRQGGREDHQHCCRWHTSTVTKAHNGVCWSGDYNRT